MDTFERIQAVARLMASFPKPWYVAGRWAMDLFANRVTRAHDDLEVAVCRRDQGALQAHMAGWALFKIAPHDEGPEIVPWVTGEWLELPIHQIVARRDEPEPHEVEFFLNDVTDGQWRFRRNPEVKRPEGEVGVMSSQGIPVVAPEIMLAYKALPSRPKDQHDFALTVPLLSADQRAWLRQTLLVCHPGHAWITRL